MRRILAILALLAAATLVFFGQAAGGSGGDYEVRAIFDNGDFVVPGEAVRVAGANVGSVASVDVTMPGEPVDKDGNAEPGKAVVVLSITDSGFQDFRNDASCLIRPQSLLGEKYIDCEPTQPRPSGSPLPPPLKVIPDGQPGAGERFLPLENNGQAVDLDLINNITRESYVDRFRLILNDLGAGLAARGKDLQDIIVRADPALRETDRVLAELSRQNRTLAKLAVNGDTDLAPLARERQHLSGFINNANTAAEATAERSQDLEAGFQKFPRALHELRLTMAKLRGFSDQATPVLSEFRTGAPAITRATKALGPFAHAATPSLITPGHGVRGEQAADRQLRPDADQDPGPGEDVGAGRQGPGHPPQELPQDRLLQAADEVPLLHDRRDQRLRPVRPLPPRRAAERPDLHDPEPGDSVGNLRRAFLQPVRRDPVASGAPEGRGQADDGAHERLQSRIRRPTGRPWTRFRLRRVGPSRHP